MKTLLITLEYPPFRGGVANYYANITKYWPIEDRIDVVDNQNERLLSGRGFFSWRRSIAFILRKRRLKAFDHLLIGHILPLGTAALFANFINPFDFSVILHGLDFSSALKTSRKRFLTNMILKKARHIICANSYTAELVAQFNHNLGKKITVINPGIEPIIPPADCEKVAEIKAQYNLSGQFTLFSLGRLVARKGIDAVISALSGDDIPIGKIKYFIAGTGQEEANLRSLAAASPFKESIFFLGALREDEKWCWLHACDAFIMPARAIGSDFEGFGIVYLEANLAKKPVIAGDSGGVRDAVIDGVNGLLVDPANTAAIRTAIRRLMADEKLRFDLGERGRARALKEFNWERQAALLSECLKK